MNQLTELSVSVLEEISVKSFGDNRYIVPKYYKVMDPYKKLALTKEQKEILDELNHVRMKAICAGLAFVQSSGYGTFAYNAKEVSCFDAPENASYDNGKEEIDITKLHFAGFLITDDLLGDYKCLVAFD